MHQDNSVKSIKFLGISAQKTCVSVIVFSRVLPRFYAPENPSWCWSLNFTLLRGEKRRCGGNITNKLYVRENYWIIFLGTLSLYVSAITYEITNVRCKKLTKNDLKLQWFLNNIRGWSLARARSDTSFLRSRFSHVLTPSLCWILNRKTLKFSLHFFKIIVNMFF